MWVESSPQEFTGTGDVEQDPLNGHWWNKGWQTGIPNFTQILQSGLTLDAWELGQEILHEEQTY